MGVRVLYEFMMSLQLMNVRLLGIMGKTKNKKTSLLSQLVTQASFPYLEGDEFMTFQSSKFQLFSLLKNPSLYFAKTFLLVLFSAE